MLEFFMFIYFCIGTGFALSLDLQKVNIIQFSIAYVFWPVIAAMKLMNGD